MELSGIASPNANHFQAKDESLTPNDSQRLRISKGVFASHSSYLFCYSVNNFLMCNDASFIQLFHSTISFNYFIELFHSTVQVKLL